MWQIIRVGKRAGDPHQGAHELHRQHVRTGEFKVAYRHYYRAVVPNCQTPHARALLDYYFARLLTERGRPYDYWLYDEHQGAAASLIAPSSLAP